jgi:translocation and assembly module TamB
MQGRLDLAGSLERMNAKLDFSVKQAKLQGEAVLMPFSEHALSDAHVDTHALDLQAVDRRLPHTALDIALNADHSGAGRLTLENRRAGAVDQGMLPLEHLHIDFSQRAQNFLLDRIDAGYGDAHIGGQGSVANGTVELALKLDKLDLHAIDHRMQATRLSGDIALHRAGNRQTAVIALTQPFAGKTAAISAYAELADQRLALDKAVIALGNGRVDFSGHMNLNGAQDFAAQGRAMHFRLQDLGRFERFPQTDINGSFTLRGARSPKLSADLDFQIADSTVADQRLRGDGQAQLRADRLRVPHLLLSAGDNRLQADGELTQAGSGQLRFLIDAPKLEQFGAEFGGQVQASGTASGKFSAPHIAADWKASRLRLPGGLRLDTMDGKLDAEIGTRTVAPLNIDVHMLGLSTPQLTAREARLGAHGSNGRHHIEAALIEEGQTWNAGADGGVREEQGQMQWKGEIRSFVAAGRYNGHLAAPAPLIVGAQRVQLEQARFEAGAADVVIERFVRDAHGIVTRGSVDKLQVAPYLKFASADPALATDLTLAGEWNLAIADTIDGKVSIRRQGGDLVMKSEVPVPLGLQRLEASATVDRGKLALQFDAEGSGLGRIAANVNAVAGSGAKRFSIVPQAPLSGSATLNVSSLAWAGALISPTLLTEGRLQGEITLAGTAAQPRIDGRVAGSDLRVFLTDSGIDLKQGSLDASFRNDTLLLKDLSFQGGQGRITASGPLRLGMGNASAQIDVVADHFAALERSDRKLTVSGRASLGWQESGAAIKGDLTVDSGYFNLGRSDAPQLSSDVVVVGRTQKASARTPVSLDVNVSIGKGVTLTGRGIEGVLLGRLHLTAASKETLRAQGELHIADGGTYAAYGRKLQIERGALLFSGPLNNPALDILAMRRGLEVEAGVAVRGTMLAPHVTLVSEPSVSDAEKLSWLVLGRGLSTVGAGDLGSLQSAAGALLSEGAASGVQSRLASALGLDTLSLGTAQQGTVQQRIVSLGKQVSARLYVGYEQGLQTASSVLHLRYTLSKRLTVEGEAGTRSALLLFFNFVFD